MIQSKEKIIPLQRYQKNSLETVVLCHGHFNIIHPGHIRYLDFASTQGEKLVVTVEGDQLNNVSDIKQQFNEIERAAGVASLEKVDKVILLGDKHLEDAVKIIEPDFLVLGK